MIMKRASLGLMMAGMVLMPFASVSGGQLLHGDVPPAITNFHLQSIGRLPVTNRLDLAIILPLRNQAELNRALAEIYDPASTNFHHYLTPEQFAERFGPSEQDYQSLIKFAEANGLTVTATHPNRALLDVNGDMETIEKVFHVKLNEYRHPTENRTFYAPDREPSIDFNLPILRISGLNNFAMPRPLASRTGSP
jgi:subtilase family serine protease